MSRLTPEQRQEILAALIAEAERAKRLTVVASNDSSMEDGLLLAALARRPWWWFPKYKSQSPSREEWTAFAGKRARLAWGFFAVALLSALVGNVLPEQIDQWMFVGNGVALAIAASWQLDVSNRERELLEVLQSRKV